MIKADTPRCKPSVQRGALRNRGIGGPRRERTSDHDGITPDGREPLGGYFCMVGAVGTRSGKAAAGVY